MEQPKICARAMRRAKPRRLLVLLLLTSMLELPLPRLAGAHGVIGNRIFLSPLVGNDAFPDNAVSLATRGSGYEFSLLPQFEKQLSANSSLLFTGGWTQINAAAKQPKVKGLIDLALWFRQAVFKSAPHEFQVTVSPFLVVPTGNRQIADQGYTHLGGELLLGKGFGDLPIPLCSDTCARSARRWSSVTRREFKDPQTAMFSAISSSNTRFDTWTISSSE